MFKASWSHSLLLVSRVEVEGGSAVPPSPLLCLSCHHLYDVVGYDPGIAYNYLSLRWTPTCNGSEGLFFGLCHTPRSGVDSTAEHILTARYRQSMKDESRE